MKNTSKTILFFGNERIATGTTTSVLTLKKLLAAGYHVAAVVAHNDPSASRKQRDLEIASVAQEHNIPLLLPHRLHDIAEQLTSYNAQLAVLVAYGKIIPQRVIDLFPQGIINLHPSLLPLHRGPTPLESVLLAGERATGVSIMQLAKEMDAGPVYAQQEVPLNGDETKQALANHLLEIGSDMMLDVIPKVLDGTAEPKAQDHANATYDHLIKKADGAIDWSKPARQLEREIRAFSGWPGSRTTLGTIEVTITKAHCVSMTGTAGKTDILEKSPIVYCGNDALCIDGIKPAGKNEMTGKAFLAGHKSVFLSS